MGTIIQSIKKEKITPSFVIISSVLLIPSSTGKMMKEIKIGIIERILTNKANIENIPTNPTNSLLLHQMQNFVTFPKSLIMNVVNKKRPNKVT